MHSSIESESNTFNKNINYESIEEMLATMPSWY